MPGAPLSLPEREEIAVALIENPDVAWAVIARRVGRHPTTITREVDGHGGRCRYRPAIADRDAGVARKRPRTPWEHVDDQVRDRIIAELRLGRSPEAIWADLNSEGVAVPCVETIYNAVYAGTLGVKAVDCLRWRRPRRRCRQARSPNNRPGLPNIDQRPAAVNDREEPGHWEADQIIGKANGSSMITLTERVTKYTIAITMPNGYAAADTLAGLVEALEQIPAHLCLSITFDQGSEWALWRDLAATYGIDVWFCDPHSPWQRGQIENVNRQLRWWFPRGTPLAAVTPEEANHATSILNNQRRRSLDYQTPASLYAHATVQ